MMRAACKRRGARALPQVGAYAYASDAAHIRAPGGGGMLVRTAGHVLYSFPRTPTAGTIGIGNWEFMIKKCR